MKHRIDMPSTSAERKRNARARDRSVGLREILIRVPERDIGEVRAFARKRLLAWQEERG